MHGEANEMGRLKAALLREFEDMEVRPHTHVRPHIHPLTIQLGCEHRDLHSSQHSSCRAVLPGGEDG